MRTVVWFIYFWGYLIALLPSMRRVKKLERDGLLTERDEYVEKVADKWAKRLMRLAGFTIEVQGQENLIDEPCVFVANHQGYFDIPTVLTTLGGVYPFVAKEEIRKMPFVTDWMEQIGCVFIHRDNIRLSMKAINQAIEKVENGKSIIIFPEGTRAKGPVPNQFKAGAFRIAEKTKSPITPVAIQGTYKAMEANHNFIKPTHIKVRILPAIATAEMSKEELRQLPAMMEQLIAKNLKEMVDNT